MKLRKPWLIKAVGWGAAWMLRAWINSLHYQYHPLAAITEPTRLPGGTRLIYAFWHEYLLLPAVRFAFTDATILIGQHADGQLITQVCKNLGMRAARGSTTRGSIEALRQLLQETHGHIAITPDGPRGPRREVQPGLIYLASRLGLPIAPSGFGLWRPWRSRSWDRFAVPRPFSRFRIVSEELIQVPANADRDTLEIYRRRVEAALHHATALAERWAEEGVAPVDARPLAETDFFPQKQAG